MNISDYQIPDIVAYHSNHDANRICLFTKKDNLCNNNYSENSLM